MGLLSHAWHAHLFRANWASAKQQEEWSAIQFLEGFTSTLPCEADAEGSGWWPCRWSIVSYHLLLPLGLCHWTQVGPSHCRRKLRKLGAWCGRGANPKGHTMAGLRFEVVWRLRRVKSWVEQQVLPFLQILRESWPQAVAYPTRSFKFPTWAESDSCCLPEDFPQISKHVIVLSWGKPEIKFGSKPKPQLSDINRPCSWPPWSLKSEGTLWHFVTSFFGREPEGIC